MTKLSDSRCAPPAGMRRWPYHAAAASALLLAAASPAGASDIGSFLGAVGGILSQGVQPHYYQYQQPQYYYQQPAPQYYQSPSYHRHYSNSSVAARRKAQAEAEAKRKEEAAEKRKKEEEAKAAAVPATVTTESSGALDVAMTRKSGNLWVPAKINNVVTIDFVIDSGASDITLPRDVYLTLIRSGTLTKANYIGGANFGIADGSEVKGLKFKLASLQVGSQVLTDVVASVMPSDSATPLLGLSFLSRFQSWSIDNKSGTLKLMPVGAKPATEVTQTAAAVVQPLPEPPGVEQPSVPVTASGVMPAAPVPPTPVANPAPVPALIKEAAAAPKLAAALPRSGHVATSAFVVKEAGAPAAPTAATEPMVRAAVPVFPANTAYASARSSLLALGYGPAPLPQSGKCDSTTDASCFPERAACAKSDAVHCDYLWRRGDELIKVQTVAVPPTVAAVECQVNCK